MSHREQRRRKLSGFDAFSPSSEGGSEKSKACLVYKRMDRVTKAGNQRQLLTSLASLAACRLSRELQGCRFCESPPVLF